MESEQRVSKQEALDLILAHWEPERTVETVPLAEAAGRALARDLTARYDLPVVRASAMDGVAISYASVKEGIPDTTAWRMGRDYVRADTGDDFDDAYDTVVAIEDVTLLPEGGLSFRPGLELRQGMNVRPSGSQLRRDELLVRAGTVLTALDLAALGMGGWGQVPVVRRPKVAFLPTGSELVPAGAELRRGQNFDTNSVMAAQLLREMGAEPVLGPILRDDPETLKTALDALLDQADIVLLNAGTSKGGEDCCGQLLEDSGGSLFHGVAAVPGRPMGAAIIQGKPVLNLSGPALACFYSLDWMVRPLVCHMLGISLPRREAVVAELTAPLRTPPMFSMLTQMRVERRADGTYTATPLAFRRPGAVSTARALTANGMYVSAPGELPHGEGTLIQVELLRQDG